MSATDRPSPPSSTEPGDPARRWLRDTTTQALQELHVGTVVEHLGIEFTEVGHQHLSARMPVDARTRQPYGILHGGASVVLAETLGSVAAILCLPPDQVAVGLEVNANHVRAAREGWVTGRVTPIHVGRSTHVWQIEVRDERERLVCTSRITMSVLARPPGG